MEKAFESLLNIIGAGVGDVGDTQMRFKYEGDLTPNGIGPVSKYICCRDVVKMVKVIFNDIEDFLNDKDAVSDFFGSGCEVPDQLFSK